LSQKVRFKVVRVKPGHEPQTIAFTDAVTTDRARCNGWNNKIRTRVTREQMEEAKRIYKEEIFAKPTFVQPHRRLPKLKPAKPRPGQAKLNFGGMDPGIKVSSQHSGAKKTPAKRKKRLKGNQPTLFEL